MLDTSVLVAMREGDARVIRRSGRIDQAGLVSILSIVELEGGVPAAPEGTAIRRMKLDEIYEVVKILPFDVGEALTYRHIVESCGFSRSKIIDRMIAAQALSVRATLATLNPRDFRDIPGLSIEDWSS